MLIFSSLLMQVLSVNVINIYHKRFKEFLQVWHQLILLYVYTRVVVHAINKLKKCW